MAGMRLPNLLATRYGRLAAFFFLYVTEGLPLGFGATAVATQLRRADVGPAEIGAFVGAFYLPWAFKWAYGPVIDVMASDRWGRRRGWIIGTQVLMALTLMSTAFLTLPQQLGLFTMVMLVHNSFGAMQDVAIDALAVGTLQEHERGLANGLMFAGAALGQAAGGAGMLFLSGYTGFLPTFFVVAGAILAVLLFVVLPMREAAAAPRPFAGLAAAGREMKRFAVDAFRAFLDTRGAYVGLVLALLPQGAMALGLALQSTLAVEFGMKDDQVASLALASSVINAACMVAGGLLSDRFGRRRTLAIYFAIMSIPTLYLMWEMQRHGWIFPLAANAPRPAAAAALATVFWIAVCGHAVGLGLMYGARVALFMDVTNPKVAATQFTAYMALSNLAIAYASTWQGIAAESIGYPNMLLIDAITGPLCILLLPWMHNAQGNTPDGKSPDRARIAAWVLGIACLLWIPFRLSPSFAGSARPVLETTFTLFFVASALFLLAGYAARGAAGGTLARVGAWLALPLLAMYARRWVGGAGMPVEALIVAVPAIAGIVLLAQGTRPWREVATPT